MTPETVISIGERALVVTSMISAPLLLAALVTGVVIGMLQAATQINEMTLSFIPKLLTMIAVLVIAGPWMITTYVDYLRRMYAAIPSLIG